MRSIVHIQALFGWWWRRWCGLCRYIGEITIVTGITWYRWWWRTLFNIWCGRWRTNAFRQWHFSAREKQTCRYPRFTRHHVHRIAIIMWFTFTCFGEFNHRAIGIVDILLGTCRCCVARTTRERRTLHESRPAFVDQYLFRLFNRTDRWTAWLFNTADWHILNTRDVIRSGVLRGYRRTEWHIHRLERVDLLEVLLVWLVVDMLKANRHS